VNIVDCPRKMLSEVALGVMVSVGATTVLLTVAVSAALALEPFTLIVPDPAVAVAAAVAVAVAVDPGLTLAGLKVTLTPLGAVAVRATAFV
jgi:hypothetical protein